MEGIQGREGASVIDVMLAAAACRQVQEELDQVAKLPRWEEMPAGIQGAADICLLCMCF